MKLAYACLAASLMLGANLLGEAARPVIVLSAKGLDNKPLHTLLLYNPSGYDEHLERQAVYTEEEARDPAVRELLRRLGDFNPVGN